MTAKAGTVLVVGVLALTLGSGTAWALTFDANITPDVIFGSGNSNGLFTVDQGAGVELGLRAKIPYAGVIHSNGDGSYSYSLAELLAADPTQRWNFDWTVNTDWDGSSGLKIDDLTYLLELDFDPSQGTNFASFDPITPTVAAPFYDHSIGTNATANGGGVEAADAATYATLIAGNNVCQQSWRYSWFPIHPTLTYDPTIDATYDVVLSAYNGATLVASTTIQVIIGAGGAPVTVYVDDDYCDTCANDGHTWGDDAFDTIPGGIAAVADAGTVHVAPGSYTSVVVDKQLTLLGAQAGVDARGRTGDESVITASAGNLVAIEAVNVVIDGFTITGAGSAGQLVRAEDSGAGLQVKNSVLGGVGVQAMWFNTSAPGVLIEQNVIDGTSLTGSYSLMHFDGSDVFDSLTIRANELRNGSIFAGNQAYNSTGLVLEDNLFDGSNMNLSSQFANALVDGNTFRNNGYTNAQLNLKNSTISNNVFEVAGPSPAAGYPSSAFMLFGDAYGLAPSENLTIECNVFEYNSIAAPDEPANGLRCVAGTDGAEITLRNNSFVDGGSQVGCFAVLHQGTGTMDAESNWWGTTDGVVIAAMMGGAVDYDPWLSGPPACPGNLLVLDVQPTSLYVQPGDNVVIKMDVSNLRQKVNACQAMLAYDSSYLNAGSVAPGGYIWDQLIWESWAILGELDTAIGVDVQGAVGTDADLTVAIITLTAGSSDGTTNVEFRPDPAQDPGLIASTFLSDMAANPVWPAKVDSQEIVIDGTAPVVDSFSAAPLCTKTTSTLTFAVSDATAGVDQVDVYVDTTLVESDVASPYSLDMSAYATGDYEVMIRVTDNAGNVTDSDDVTVSVDQTAPVIASVTATQGSASVLCGDGVALQGVVDIYADVSDADCAGLVAPPTVTVDGMVVSYVDVSGDTFHYQVTVETATGNGAHVITVAAEDALGNASSDSSASLCVDKNQVTGSVELQQFIGTSRDVTFVATDSGGGVLASWTLTIDDFAGAAVGTYTLTEVPDGVAGLSAKTGWNLRSKLAVALDGDGQAIANFTGDDLLPGGDLNESNSVNILDYSIMKTSWYVNNDADIDGDGSTALLDYNLMKLNWFTVGDAE